MGSWFNDAVSTASDLTALQLIFEYWNPDFPGWALGLIFWVALVLANIITVRAYGEVCCGDHVEFNTLIDLAYSLNIGSAS